MPHNKNCRICFCFIDRFVDVCILALYTQSTYTLKHPKNDWALCVYPQNILFCFVYPHQFQPRLTSRFQSVRKLTNHTGSRLFLFLFWYFVEHWAFICYSRIENRKCEWMLNNIQWLCLYVYDSHDANECVKISTLMYVSEWMSVICNNTTNNHHHELSVLVFLLVDICTSIKYTLRVLYWYWKLALILFSNINTALTESIFCHNDYENWRKIDICPHKKFNDIVTHFQFISFHSNVCLWICKRAMRYKFVIIFFPFPKKEPSCWK